MSQSKRRKQRFKALIGDRCTGCGSSPVCMALCCTDGALEFVEDEEVFPFRSVRVNPDKCVGCGLCVAGGYEGTIVEGCPWDAITLIPSEEVGKAEVEGVAEQAL